MRARRRVLAFGTFDKLHAGHEVFLRWAREQAGNDGELVVAVARDSVVGMLKGRAPQHSEGERVEALSQHPHVSRVVLSDEVPRTWAVLERESPDVIALGYDQTALRKALEELLAKGTHSFTLATCPEAHEPERLHSSLLRDA